MMSLPGIEATMQVRSFTVCNPEPDAEDLGGHGKVPETHWVRRTEWAECSGV